MKISRSIILTFFLCGCASVPVTDRKQLSLVPNDQLIEMSSQQYQQVLAENDLADNEEWESWVKNSGQKIKSAVEQYFQDRGSADHLSGYDWEFNLLKADSVVNAWAMPGGKVAFYTGIIPICKDENGVAVVMGHEVAHAVANHGRERVSQQMAAQFGLTALSVALGAGAGGSIPPDLVLQAAGAGTQLGILSFSRKHESEADHLGLIFMAMAGYDPREAPKFWERMSTGSGGQPPEFLSTHPSHDTRIQDLNEWMPEALQYYNP
jgi:predicted Zn-dependent protease